MEERMIQDIQWDFSESGSPSPIQMIYKDPIGKEFLLRKLTCPNCSKRSMGVYKDGMNGPRGNDTCFGCTKCNCYSWGKKDL